MLQVFPDISNKFKHRRKKVINNAIVKYVDIIEKTYFNPPFLSNILRFYAGIHTVNYDVVGSSKETPRRAVLQPYRRFKRAH